MAQAQGGMSSFQFKDPFDLLSDLHNARFQFLYKNEFARGSRPNMKEVAGGGYGGGLPTSQANTHLPVNAPSRMMDRSHPIKGGQPPIRQLSAPQNFGTPELARNEEARLGKSKILGLGAKGVNLGRDLYKNYAFNREHGEKVQQLNDLNQQMGRISDLTDEVQNNMEINKNLTGMRERQRQAQARTALERTRGMIPGVVASVFGESGNPANTLTPVVGSANRAGMERLNTMESQNAARFANQQRLKAGGRTVQDIMRERMAQTFEGVRGNVPPQAAEPAGSPYHMLNPPNISEANRNLLEGLDQAYQQYAQGGSGAPTLPAPSQMPSSPAQGGGTPSFPVSPNPNPVPAGPTSPFPQPPTFNKEGNTEALGGAGLSKPALRPTPKPTVTPKPEPKKPKGKTPKKPS